jgi:signal transduction histidine kinase
LVAIASYLVADSAAVNQLDQRFEAIGRSIRDSNFPLSRGVLMTLRELTSAHWFTVSADGDVIDGTVADASAMTAQTRQRWKTLLASVPLSEPAAVGEPAERLAATKLRIGADVYRAKRFRASAAGRRPGDVAQGGTVSDCVVMFDDSQWRDIRFRAAAAPLATGLSTVAVLTTITLLLTGRLVRRLTRLQREVEAIAGGNFESRLAAGPDDEIGRLGRAVESMAGQLRQMWKAVGRQHGERLLHQIAGGLAHNLRNSLTGARMAIELHRCGGEGDRDSSGNDGIKPGLPANGTPPPDDDGLRIAIAQLEQAEDYVRRLLLVSQGKQDVDRPSSVGESLGGIIGSLDNSARHLGVSLAWSVPDESLRWHVADGPTLTAAVTNLVWNAIQAGGDVRVDVAGDSRFGSDVNGRVRVEVSDDGPGPAAEVADTLFEPLVTTKPEGMGLGLPLVKRSAESLGGDIRWTRRDGRTVFILDFPVFP